MTDVRNAMDALSPRERRFVEEYCANGFRATDAARAVGYQGKNVKISAYKLLQKPNIAAAVDAHLKDLADRAQLRSEAILLELAKVAFSDIGEVLDFSGDVPRLKPAKDIPSEARQSIESIKVKRFVEGRGEDSDQVEVTEFKLHDKLGALEKLGRYRKLFTDKVEHSGGIRVDDLLLERAQRAMGGDGTGSR
jgi:phage terminase small subunit